jgi:hypothetical protein
VLISCLQCVGGGSGVTPSQATPVADAIRGEPSIS